MIGTGLSNTEIYSLAYDPIGKTMIAGAQDIGAFDQFGANNKSWKIATTHNGVLAQGDGGGVKVMPERRDGIDFARRFFSSRSRFSGPNSLRSLPLWKRSHRRHDCCLSHCV
jgi:hypothetical protein